MRFDDEEIRELMQILTHYLGSTLRELVVNASVVLLMGVKLAEIHRLCQSRASTKERFNAAVFNC